MDTLQGYGAAGGSDALEYADEEAYGDAPPPEIGTDERRMHVRAYNYWASLLGARNFPSIEDLNPDRIGDFGPNSVLLDFTGGIEDPAVPYLGAALRRECGIEGPLGHIGDVPPRSLLSRLTDHYLQIIANAAPIGFEAEFVNQRGADIVYRGILMPFSSDGETIDFVYGVISWKEVANSALTDELLLEVSQVLRDLPDMGDGTPPWGAAASADERVPAKTAARPIAPVIAPMAMDGELPELILTEADILGPDATLADWLAVARDSAMEARTSDARTRSALYRALGRAYDFAVAAQDSPRDYTEILEDAGIRAQARSPMTAVVKLVFGADYDKTRLTEYATALDHGWAQGLHPGRFAPYLESYAGGLKGLVQDERAARRAEKPARPDRTQAARDRLKGAAALTPAQIATDDHGLAVLVARREADGSFAIVATLAEDTRLADQVVRKVAS